MLTFPTSYFLIEGRFDFKAEHVLIWCTKGEWVRKELCHCFCPWKSFSLESFVGLWFLSSPFSSSFSFFPSLSSFSYYSYHFYKTESYFVAYTGLEFTMWPRLGNLWIILLPKFPLNSQVLKFQTWVNMPNWMHSYAWRLTFNRCLHLPDRLARMPFSCAPKALSANTNPGFQCWATYRADISWVLLIPVDCWALLGLSPCHLRWILCYWTPRPPLAFNKLSLSLSR